MKRHCISFLLAFAIAAVLVGCTPAAEPESTVTSTETEPPIVTDSTAPPTVSPESVPQLAPEHEIELVAKVLRGECYDDQPDDKREVVKVICNRVSANGFGDSIESVVTAKGQFYGYRASNEPTTNDYEIAREVLTAWYEGGCAPLGEYLFFSSGGGHKNVFRKTWKEVSP
jgi:hypothetical protein